MRRLAAPLLVLAFIGVAIADIKIGGLFEAGEDIVEMAFNSAVERINTHGLAEPGERYTPTSDRLLTRVEHIERSDSFQASRKVCTLLEEGVAAVFGPQSTDASFAVRSACETLDVPHIETHWDYRSRTTNHSLNLYPHPSALGKAYLDFIKYKDWKNFAILYEENDALVRLQEILKDATLMKENRVTVRQFEPGTEYRKTLKDIGKTGIKNIVLDVPIKSLYTVLKHAQQVDMMSEYHNYFITSLDAHTIDTEDFQYGGTNISAFRLIDFSSKEIDEVARDWIQRRHRFSNKKSSSVQSYNTGDQDFYKNLTTKVALMYDAVRLFATALKDLHPETGPKITVQPLSCEREHKWSQGNAFVKYMRMINIKGLTGNIRFNKDGHRTDMRLTVLDMAHSGWREAGEWTMLGGINITTNYTRELEEARLSLLNKTLVVTTILQPPYVMYKENWRELGLTGNDKYEGYCIDLLDSIASSEHFINNMKYVIREVADNSYGRKDADGRWNGMIGELLNGKADLAVADLTITYVREEAVDFTMPFMTLGISILYKKTAKPPPGLFSFLDPLSLEVWIYMMTAFLGVSLFLFVLARFSPYEWVNPHPCEGNPEELDNQFTIWNTLWFTIGCLMQQGCDVTPRALSTRVAAGMWWFFTLIMVSSYTANLAAFLTVERLVSPIESVEDLAKQTTIQYGCLRSGSTQSFFKDSQFPTYAKMWHVMQSQRPTVFAESNQKGIDRVLRGKYAYLMESTSIEYNIERNCDLTQIGSLLDNKGYGIATPPGSPYRTMLSQAILRLQENGDLHVLKAGLSWSLEKVLHAFSAEMGCMPHVLVSLLAGCMFFECFYSRQDHQERWWKKQRITKKCPKDIINKGTSAMTVASVGGVFIVLLVGSCIAVISAIVEFVWRAKKIVPEERDPLCVELCRELKFTLTCGSKKPLARPRSDENLAIAATDNGMPFMPITGFGLHNKNTFS